MEAAAGAIVPEMPVHAKRKLAAATLALSAVEKDVEETRKILAEPEIDEEVGELDVGKYEQELEKLQRMVEDHTGYFSALSAKLAAQEALDAQQEETPKGANKAGKSASLAEEAGRLFVV